MGGSDRRLLVSLGRAIDECIKSGGIVVAALPTGYGKTSFIRLKLIDKIAKDRLRVAHVLPLRAIVRDAAVRAVKEARKYGRPTAVGFQAGLEVTDIDKSPYLARHYMIVTIDSFLLSFYGIPIYEMYRNAWHSDAAYTLARSFNLLVLDEYHLMVTGDAESDENEVDLIAKQLASISRVLADYVSSGRCVAIFTATLPPSILVETIKRASELMRIKPRIWIVAFGEESGAYIKEIINGLQPIAKNIHLDTAIDDSFKACGHMATTILKVAYRPGNVGSMSVPIPRLEEAVDTVMDILVKGGCDRFNSIGVFVAFNSWRRAYAAYMTYSKLFEKLFGCKALLLTGKMAPGDRDSVLAELDKASRSKTPICLFATQVIEAGVDVSFDVLVTEAAPATALIQRVGRVSRYNKPGPCNAVVILVDEKDGASRAIRGVYDFESTRKTLDALKACIDRRGFFEWRCVDSRGCDAWNLVTVLDSVLKSRRELTEFYTSEEELEKMLALTLPPRYVVEALDRVFDGSFVRSSALIPLLPTEALMDATGLKVNCIEICEDGLVAEVKDPHRLFESIVTVDKGFLRSRPGLLCKCADERVLVAFMDSGGNGLLIKVLKGVGIRELNKRPLFAMWRLSRYGGSLVGFLIPEGTYKRGFGLIPV